MNQPREVVADAKRRVFIDMDGVIVDFDLFKTERGLTGDEVKSMVGAYLAMPAMPGAIEAVRSLIGMGFEVWLATKPPTGIPHAYSDKAAWVMEHLPELKRRIIITHDKGLLGNQHDYLCDDRPHKANCERFAGTLLRFVDGYHWPDALAFFRTQNPRITAPQPGASEGVEERWVVARQSVLDIGLGDDVRTGGKPEIGYALIANAGTFESAAAARQAHRQANLPLGWVVMPLSQLLPDLSAAALRTRAKTEGEAASA